MPNRKTQQHGPERFFLTPAPPGRSPLRSTAPSTRAILLFPAVLTFFFACGCDTFPFPAQSSRTPPDVPRQLDVSQGYLPTHIRIMGLTGFKLGEYGTDTAALEVYIDMLDRFDSRIKAPGVFRLELYEYVPRSSNPRGKRIMIWDDIDLT
ncbi:MAG: hypothetical protein JW828_13480, partial [Sedimentisphaerales bacterium]|nr:hypothetical protein [Sedimentisphaerales bacterium]